MTIEISAECRAATIGNRLNRETHQVEQYEISAKWVLTRDANALGTRSYESEVEAIADIPRVTAAIEADEKREVAAQRKNLRRYGRRFPVDCDKYA